MNTTIALAQARQSQLRAEYFKLRVETGAYITRLNKVFDGHGRPLTADELMLNELQTMHRHIEIADMLIEQCLASPSHELAQVADASARTIRDMWEVMSNIPDSMLPPDHPIFLEIRKSLDLLDAYRG